MLGILMASAMLPSMAEHSTIQFRKFGDRTRISDLTAQVHYKALPSKRYLKKILPSSKQGIGYAHVECSSISPDGWLVDCKTSTNGLGQNDIPDSDYEIAGLKAVSQMRVEAQSFTGRQSNILFVSIDMMFKSGGVEQRKSHWGACFPFCSSDVR